MSKIINIGKIQPLVSKLHRDEKSIVLAGGCFDILHIGHIKFLEEAKYLGDILVILLESDERVKKLKGKNRPVFSQTERAYMLSALSYVDYIILLPYISSNSEYDKLVLELKPDIIAVTENDPLIKIKKNQAEKVGGQLKIIPYAETYSSSKLAKLLGID